MTARNLLSTSAGRFTGGSGLLSSQSPSSGRSTAPLPVVTRVATSTVSTAGVQRSRRCVRELGGRALSHKTRTVLLDLRSLTSLGRAHRSPPTVTNDAAAREMLEYLAASGSDLCALAGSPPARPSNAQVRDVAFAARPQAATFAPAASAHGVHHARASPAVVQVGFACGGGDNNRAEATGGVHHGV
jgi:hypothetical protein